LQLATCGFYGDFLLLDPRDAPAVLDFLQGKESGKEDIPAYRGGSAPSKTRNNVFASPNVRSGGTARRRTPGKGPIPGEVPTPGKVPEIAGHSHDNILDPNVNPGDWSGHPFDHPFEPDIPGPSMSQHDDEDTGCPDPDSGSDDEDPYELLDPHEPSNLKIKPYKRGIGRCCFQTKLIYFLICYLQ
jgi:condensin-2 complex subunit H2